MDTLKIVTFDYRGGRPTVVRDLNNGTTFELVRDTFKFTPAEKQQQFSQATRRYGGAELASEVHGNGTVEAEWYVKDSTADLSVTAAENLINEIESATVGGNKMLMWQPEGTTYPVFFQIRGGLPWEPMYRWVEFATTKTMHVKAALAVAPLAEGYPMYNTDRFLVDSEADYTYDSGSAADTAIANGAFTASGNLTATKRVISAYKGYTAGDQGGTIWFVPGTTITNSKFELILKRVDANNYLTIYVDDNGTNSRIRVDKVVAGTPTNISTANLGARITTGTDYFLSGRIERNGINFELWTRGDTPQEEANTADLATSTTIVDTVYGESVKGYGGFAMTPQSSNAAIKHFEWRPHTYNRTAKGTSAIILPDETPIVGGVPGTAKAKVDVEFLRPMGSTGGTHSIYGLHTWIPKPPPWNWLWNGDFDYNGVQGWSVAAVSGVTGAATSITTDTTGNIKNGTINGRVQTPATANVGTTFAIHRRFKIGVTYTMNVWVSAPSSTTNVRARLGVSGDIASSSAAALTTTPTLHTLTWTPTAERDIAYACIEQTAATASDFRIDDVQVFEGTTAPTLMSQTEGRGAPPPFGVLQAASCFTSPLTNFAITSSVSGSRFGTALQYSTSGAQTPAAEWLVDPNLLVPDEFGGDTVAVEVFARLKLGSGIVSPVGILSSTSFEGFGGTAGPIRYSLEYGSSGKSFVLPSTTDIFRVFRMGTLVFNIDRNAPQAWRVKLAFTTAAGSTGNMGIDYLYFAPVSSRFCGPTGKTVSFATYPGFIPWRQYPKLVKSDLSAQVKRVSHSSPFATMFPDVGVGGEPIEYPPGDVLTSSLLLDAPPDPPVAYSSSDNGGAVHTRIIHDITPRYNMARS